VPRLFELYNNLLQLNSHSAIESEEVNGDSEGSVQNNGFTYSF